MKLIIYILIFMTLSCSNIRNESASKHQRDSIAEPGVISTKYEIVNSSFANEPLGEFYFKYTDLSSHFKGSYNIHFKTIMNKFEEATDTLIYYQIGTSTVRFYKTKEKIYLDSLNVSDKNFVKIAGGIEIGMEKQDFLNYFKVYNEPYSDSIDVTNGENSDVRFLFINNKLNNVSIIPF